MVLEGTVKVAALDKVIPLLAFKVTFPVTTKSPPLNVSLSASIVLGFPRLLSLEIDISPALIAIIPVKLLLFPDKVKVPAPALVNFSSPTKVPEKVWSLPSPAVKAASAKLIVPAPAIDKIVSVASTS